jgi:hypothetical protein
MSHHIVDDARYVARAADQMNAAGEIALVLVVVARVHHRRGDKACIGEGHGGVAVSQGAAARAVRDHDERIRSGLRVRTGAEGGGRPDPHGKRAVVGIGCDGIRDAGCARRGGVEKECNHGRDQMQFHAMGIQ